MGREKLKSILKYFLTDPEDLNELRIVKDERGEYWLEWEE